VATEARLAAPVLIVIGRVVALADVLAAPVDASGLSNDGARTARHG
jgi:siroheme synthase